MNQIKNILLIINYDKNISSEYVSNLIDRLTEKDRCVFVFKDTLEKFKSLGIEYTPRTVNSGGNLSEINLAVVLGGDGSIIRAARQICAYDIPILGVNFGHIGFLAELEEGDLSRISEILDGNLIIEERLMLSAKIVKRDGSTVCTPPALNDIVLSNGPVAKLLHFDVSCDDVIIQRCRADGMIIATPTGSTAYSMSAGGPILAPALDAYCLTPICPHSLNNRPVILPGASAVSLVNISTVEENSVYLTVDGNRAEKLSEGDSVVIERAETTTKLIRLNKNSFLSVLKSKL